MLMGFAGIAHFNRVGISVAGSEIFIKHYHFNETQMGWVYTTFLIVYTMLMLPGGWFIDRFGAGRALTLLGIGMGTFVMLTGTLAWLTNGPENLWLGLLIIRGFAGACNTPLHPGAAHVVSDLMSDRNRATANGMITAGALIGIACCYPIFGYLIDTLTWPWAFVLCGGVLVGYGLLWSRSASPVLPVPHRGQTDVRTHGADDSTVDSRSALTVLFQLNLWLVTLSYAAYSYLQYLFFYWMSYYFETVLKVPDVGSRQSAFYITLAQGAGMAIGGVSTDVICRLFGTTIGRRSIAMTGMSLGALFGLLGVWVTGQWNVTICLAISMAALGMCEGVFWTTATDIGGKARGFAGAFMNTGGNVGGLISPVLTPFLATSLKWSGAIAVACVISAFGGLLWLLIKLPNRNDATTAR